MSTVDEQTKEPCSSEAEAVPWAALISSVLVRRATDQALPAGEKALTSPGVLQQLCKADILERNIDL